MQSRTCTCASPIKLNQEGGPQYAHRGIHIFNTPNHGGVADCHGLVGRSMAPNCRQTRLRPSERPLRKSRMQGQPPPKSTAISARLTTTISYVVAARDAVTDLYLRIADKTKPRRRAAVRPRRDTHFEYTTPQRGSERSRTSGKRHGAEPSPNSSSA